MPAPFSKKAGQYRWQLLLQHPSRATLHQVLTAFGRDQSDQATKVRWILDVDPLDLS